MSLDNASSFGIGLLIGGAVAFLSIDHVDERPNCQTGPTNQFVINVPDGVTFTMPLIEAGATTEFRDSNFSDIDTKGAVIEFPAQDKPR